MAGAMKIYELSASLAGTDKTSGTVRFKNANDATVDSNDPITIPSTGTVNSFIKNLRFYCATAPGQYIDNLQAYSDGSNSYRTGVTLNATNANGAFLAASSAIVGGNDLFGYTSGAPMDLDQYHTASVNATGFCGDIMQIQMVVASITNSGTLNASETITFSYDEI